MKFQHFFFCLSITIWMCRVKCWCIHLRIEYDMHLNSLLLSLYLYPSLSLCSSLPLHINAEFNSKQQKRKYSLIRIIRHLKRCVETKNMHCQWNQPGFQYNIEQYDGWALFFCCAWKPTLNTVQQWKIVYFFYPALSTNKNATNESLNGNDEAGKKWI